MHEEPVKRPDPDDRPEISVIVVVRNRPTFLRRCLDSLTRQTATRFEVLVLLNGATAQVRRIVDERRTADPRVRGVVTAPGTASAARNHGVALAAAPIIYFIDDDVIVPENGLAALATEFERRPGFDVVGGPNLTPPDDPDFAQMTGELLASRWGTGRSYARYRRQPPHAGNEREIILCNMGVRRQLFQSKLRFPDFFPGEENALMGRVIAAGGKIWYSPEVVVYHHRRSRLRDYLAQVVQYGRGRAFAMLSAPRTRHPAFFLPVLLLGYTAALPVLLVISPWSAAPLAIYLLGTTVASVRICRRRGRARWLLPLIGLFPLTHLLYGWGLLSTLLNQGGATLLSRARRGRLADEPLIPPD